MISVKNLSFRYHENTPALLRDLSFDLNQGEVLSILGKNGVGKTTFLRCLMGELKSYTGSIYFDTKEVKTLSTVDRSFYVSLVASNDHCFQDLIVADYLVMGFTNRLTSFQSPTQEQYECAAQVLEEMKHSDLFTRRIFGLSSGEMQIIRIARSILQNPKVIIFDEPTSNLDVANQLLVLDQISALSEKGYTLITTTHNPGQSIELGGKVLLLTGDANIVGNTSELLTADLLSKTYSLDVHTDMYKNRQITTFVDQQSSQGHILIY